MKNAGRYFTVGELIRALESLPQDILVLVSGYENGYESFYPPRIVRLKHFPENPYYDGEYQIAEKDDKDWIEGVILSRVESE